MEAKLTSPTRHAHSHSHIGLPSGLNPPLTSVPLTKSGSSEGPVRYRASVDSNAQASQAHARGNNRWEQRPQSEYLGAGKKDDAEAQALDQWFNDLSHYEKTLEDMATAALDANFKEELSAIEQWFKVLSEAERTAALYSLLQSSTPVQMRFFVTVLQQMLKRDPVGQLLSPTNPLSLESQMEAKLASLGLKSPSPPSTRNGSRQSTTPSNEQSFLSPSAAAGMTVDKGKVRSRTSAPANLLLAQSNKDDSARWSERNSVPERRTPSPRLSVNGEAVPHSAAPHISSFATPRSNEGEMSPLALAGASWSSLVQTPLAPMFGDANTFGGLSSSPNLGSSTTWGSPNTNIVLDDPRKFRRSARVSGNGASGADFGALDGMYKSTRQRSPTSQTAFSTTSSYPSSPYAGQHGNRSSPTASTHMAAQQAALSAQQNWRATQASSPALAASASSPAMRAATDQTQQMAQLLALQQQLQISQLNLAAAASIAAMSSPANLAGMSPAQLVSLQQQQAATAAALLTPNRFGATFAHQQQQPLSPSMMHNAPLSPRRSPRGGNGFGNSVNGRSVSSASQQQQQQQPQAPLNNGTNADEPIDKALLNDVPAWLRSLRLHKYTTNFEKMNWKELVSLDDAALERHGVLALGARRKLLKVFENVRIKMDMALPGDGQASGNDAHSEQDNDVTMGEKGKDEE